MFTNCKTVNILVIFCLVIIDKKTGYKIRYETFIINMLIEHLFNVTSIIIC